jgi:hypothetical protein
MTTVRQIERFWQSNELAGLVAHLCADRPEFGLLSGGKSKVIAAALGVIRIDEFGQSFQPIAGKLIRVLIAAQELDGGWGDTAATAIALRALSCSRGEGLAIERGVNWLAGLQKADGAWPDGPPRRLPADAATTAFVLLHLGHDRRLHVAARITDAAAWLSANEEQLDASGKRLAQRAILRCRSARQTTAAPLFAAAA